MHATSTDSKILDRIHGHGPGWVFTPAQLADLGTRNAAASALKRFKATGTIRQLARGLYDYPVQDSVLGTVAPSADAIARALVVRDAVRLQPSGAYAANVLGLSEQVPSRIVFLTGGPARKVKIGKREILLQHTTPRNMATAGTPQIAPDNGARYFENSARRYNHTKPVGLLLSRIVAHCVRPGPGWDKTYRTIEVLFKCRRTLGNASGAVCK